MELNEKEREEQREAAVRDKPTIPLAEVLDETVQVALDLTTKVIILLHHARALYVRSKDSLSNGKWEEANNLRAEGTQYFKDAEKLFKEGPK